MSILYGLLYNTKMIRSCLRVRTCMGRQGDGEIIFRDGEMGLHGEQGVMWRIIQRRVVAMLLPRPGQQHAAPWTLAHPAPPDQPAP